MVGATVPMAAAATSRWGTEFRQEHASGLIPSSSVTGLFFFSTGLTAENKLGLDPNDPHGKDDITTLNELHIPVDTDFILRGSSKDVIHSFSVPVLRVKQDLIPGMLVPIWLKATKTSDHLRDALIRSVPLDDAFENRAFNYRAMADAGDIVKTGAGFNDDIVKRLRAAGVKEVSAAPLNPIEIACAQLCGNNHFKMKGFVVIESRASFDAWLAAQAAELEEEDEWDEEG